MSFTQAFGSLALLALSGGLIDVHRRVWRQAQADYTLSGRGRRFARAQYWRRMFASSTIGVVGVLFTLKSAIPPKPLPMTLYVAALLLACLLILLGGVADAYATARYHLRTLRRRQRRQARMLLELAHAVEHSSGQVVSSRSGDA